MQRDVFGDKLSLDFRLLYFLNIEQDFFARQFGELSFHVLDLLPFLADDDARASGEDLNTDTVAGALNEDTWNGSLLEFLHQRGADDLILVEQLGEILLARKPA